VWVPAFLSAFPLVGTNLHGLTAYGWPTAIVFFYHSPTCHHHL
jgi:hypothetical protein